MSAVRKRKRQASRSDGSKLESSEPGGRCNTADTKVAKITKIQHRRPKQTQKHSRMVSDDTPPTKRHRSLPKERKLPVQPTPSPISASSLPVLSVSGPSLRPVGPAVERAVLAQYYPRVCSLRRHLLTSLPSSSRIRRKKLSLVGSQPDAKPVELLLSKLLDEALVACPGYEDKDKDADGQGCVKSRCRGDNGRSHLHELRLSFSQTRRADESAVTVSNAAEGAFSPQSEIVDFAIWLLFQRAKKATKDRSSSDVFRRFNDFPKNVLCYGFQRSQGPRHLENDQDSGCPYPCASNIPGLYATKPSQQVQILKEMPWPQLLAILGASGEQIMADLLIGCSVFLPVEAGHGNFVQITGEPLGDIPLLAGKASADGHDERPLSDITLTRSRIYYARPSMTVAGSVVFGLHHIHILNRLPHRHYVNGRVIKRKAEINHTNTLHTMMYIFPRQFGLHNVFTSTVNRSTTAQKFQDYTLREEEIADKFGLINEDGSGAKIHVPKRLRGLPVELVDKMRILHSRCSYYALLQHYCPDSTKTAQTGDSEHTPQIELFTPGLIEAGQIDTNEKPTERRLKVSDSTIEAHDTTKTTRQDGSGVSVKGVQTETPEEAEGTTGGLPEAVTNETADDNPVESAENAAIYKTPKSTEEVTEDVFRAPPAPISMSSLIQLATPLPRVSAFCQALCRNIIPNDFWGSGDIQKHNKALFLKKVDSFIHMRRFETTNMHDLLQGMKIADVAWLAPPRSGNSTSRAKLSQTDLRKRKEIFAEFLYYIFDSFLIPLIRGHFYVTESNVFRNRLFFFRHDVWRRIAEPALANLKADMFEEMKQSEALRILESRDLSYGQVRLLPKQASMRPIVNLRRRGQKLGTRDGSLAPSINTILAPVQTMLKLEMKEHPERLGSSLFSLSGLYTRLKEFKLQQQERTPKGQTFYFAKVDVKSAFDTIPQKAMVELISRLPTHERYHVDKYVEVAAPQKEAAGAKPPRYWKFVAKAGTDGSGFLDSVEKDLGLRRKNTVFVDNAFRRTREAESLVSLTAVHILQNLVKIGKKFYRQKSGIPQGSVLSSLLCNYFYADLETTELSFLKADGQGEDENDYLLLRLIDDFLLITTNRAKAARFVEAMQRGQPKYGVTVNPGKSLVNFDLEVDGATVPKQASGTPFPYCGTLINCVTLDITRDRTTKDQSVFNSLTVEYARTPGHHFKRKVFGFLKTQSQFMFFDTSHNSVRTTLQNLDGAFAETAMKMWAYARCLPKGRRPSAELTISVIKELADVGYIMLLASNNRTRGKRARESPENSSDSTSQVAPLPINKTQFTWLVLHAFLGVLRRKQSGYTNVVRWLRLEMQQLKGRKGLRLPKQFMGV